MPDVICPECNKKTWVEGEELCDGADDIAKVECQECHKIIGVFWYPLFDTLKMSEYEYASRPTSGCS